MNKSVYMYILMKSSFPKHDLQTWHCHCNLNFLSWRLNGTVKQRGWGLTNRMEMAGATVVAEV